jgi:hypothetical protein
MQKKEEKPKKGFTFFSSSLLHRPTLHLFFEKWYDSNGIQNIERTREKRRQSVEKILVVIALMTSHEKKRIALRHFFCRLFIMH